MFYFFQRGAEFLQCEIRGDDTAGYEIVITEPKRPERRESFPTSDDAYKRWVELQDRSSPTAGGDRTAATSATRVSVPWIAAGQS